MPQVSKSENLQEVGRKIRYYREKKKMSQLELAEAIGATQEFLYIEAINNRTKHTADIANKLSMGILGSSNTTEIGPFFRKDVQHDKIELSDQLQATIDFLDKSWDEFMIVFQEEYVRDVYVENRRHTISGVHQQRLKDEPDQQHFFICNKLNRYGILMFKVMCSGYIWEE